MSRIFRLLAILGAIMLLQTSSALAQDQVTLTVNIWPSPTHNLNAEVMIPWTRLVEEATEGRVTFNIPAAALASGRGIYDAVAGGVADVAYGIHGYTPARFPISKIVEFPNTGNSATSLSVAYWRTYKALLEQHMRHPGVVVLGLFTHGPGSIFTRNKQIHLVEDLKNVKMRTGGGFQREISRMFEAVVVAAEAPQNYEILSRGVADGTYLPIASAFRYNLQDFVKYHTAVPGGLYNTSFVFMMNKEKWDSLSPQDQAAIWSVSGENLARMAGASWDKQEREGAELLAASDISSITAGPDFMAELHRRMKPYEDDWVTEVERKRGLDGEAALTMLRAEAAKVEAELANAN